MIQSIQYLRAIAALAVVFFHATGGAKDYFGYVSPLDPLLLRGYYGVDVFFVISGFVIAMMVIGKGQGRGTFVVNRIARIIPPYWLLTLAFAALYVAATSLFRQTHIGAQDVLASLAFASPLWGKYPIIIPGWSLTYECAFYLAVIVLYRRFRDLRLGALLVCVALFGLMPLCLQLVRIELKLLNMLYFLQFVTGVACFLMRSGRIGRWQFASVVAAILLAECAYGDTNILTGNLLGGISLLVLLRIEDKAPAAFTNPLMIRLGDASYAIYLIQVFTLPAFAKALVQIPFLSDSAKGGSLIALGPVVTALAGLIFYFLVEKRLVDAARRLLLRFA